jgi:hypothetical protein
MRRTRPCRKSPEVATGRAFRAFAPEQQRRSVELQPCLKHLPLAKAVFGWLGSPRSSRSFTMSRSLPVRPVRARGLLRRLPDRRPGPGSGAQTKAGSPSGRVRPHRIEQPVHGHNGHIDTHQGMGTGHAWPRRSASSASAFSAR